MPHLIQMYEHAQIQRANSATSVYGSSNNSSSAGDDATAGAGGMVGRAIRFRVQEVRRAMGASELGPALLGIQDDEAVSGGGGAGGGGVITTIVAGAAGEDTALAGEGPMFLATDDIDEEDDEW